MGALCEAAGRGVDVRILVNGPHIDKQLVRRAGQQTCVPYVDTRQSQSQVSMDTDVPPNFSAGFQVAYLLNDERQANRKTSQVVVTAFLELHTSVGELR